MIGAGHPEGVEALHAFPADENILQRIVERVPQMQRAGHIGRRNDDRVGLFRRVGVTIEITLVEPALINLRFVLGVVVLLGKLLHDVVGSVGC